MTTNQARPDVVPSGAASSEKPLLSGGGRAFLDGAIDADEYVEAARHSAAVHARREVNIDVSKQRGPIRKSAGRVLFIGAGAYGVLGALSFGWESLTVGATALVTGAIFALLGFAISAHFRGDDKIIASLIRALQKYPKDPI